MRFACWIIEATNTKSARQKWLRERTSNLRYAYSKLPVLFSLKQGGQAGRRVHPASFSVDIQDKQFGLQDKH
jgi:hypothetical protein